MLLDTNFTLIIPIGFNSDLKGPKIIFLIIISPNPLSYILFPIKELYFFLYCKFLKFSKNVN